MINGLIMFPSSSDTAENSNDIVFIDKDDISNYNPEQILPLSPEIIAKIRCWLQPTAYDSESGEYRKHLASHAHGTSTWVTSHSTYLDWLQSTEAGTLWIKGIPGSGKSVLTSHVVHELALEHPGVPVLYFFFRQIVNANHHPISLLRDWVDQVLVYSPPLQHHLEAHLKTRRSLDTLSMNDLWDVLRLALKSLPKGAYCIVDALDEMDGGNEVFLRALADLGEWMPESLKVMVTSRPVPSIEAMLRPFKTLQIRLNELDVDRDIVTFVQRKLDSTHITGSDRQLILDAVPGRANGLFLFAKLAMDSILEPGANISAVLESLPANLDDMYTKLLQYQADSSGVPEDIQRLVLQCATHAPRPLRCLELADMIEIVHFSKNVNDRDAMVAKDLVRTACGPLLEIIADETVRVVHHSLTEYLIGTTRADKPVGYPILKHDATHATLALSCLAYLEAVCRASTKGGESSHRNHPKWTFEQSARYPFFEYAATNWSWHVVKSGASQLYQKEVIEATHQFFQETEQRKMWLRFKWSSVFEYVEGIPPLYIATRLGIEAYVRELLTDSNRLDVDVDVQDAWGRTPLWWAASLGHTSILRLLVAEGANPDHADHHNGLKPLHEAVAHNHVQVVKILLEERMQMPPIPTVTRPCTRYRELPSYASLLRLVEQTSIKGGRMVKHRSFASWGSRDPWTLSAPCWSTEPTTTRLTSKRMALCIQPSQLIYRLRNGELSSRHCSIRERILMRKMQTGTPHSTY
ncbi:hypothetical protein GGS20DRAFT_260186 [Poronia punctata]|nr:hypothetical protein GGS20DRAFT_260186 [Poronia punctata]